MVNHWDIKSLKAAVESRLNFNVVTAVFFILLSMGILAAIPYQIEKPLVLIGMPQSGLDPALFPLISAGCLLLISIWYLLISFKLEEKNLLAEINREGLVNIFITVAAFFLYAILMEALGFILSSTLLVGGLTLFYGTRNVLAILISSVVVPLVIYLLFTRLLLVHLPGNAFYEIYWF